MARPRQPKLEAAATDGTGDDELILPVELTPDQSVPGSWHVAKAERDAWLKAHGVDPKDHNAVEAVLSDSGEAHGFPATIRDRMHARQVGLEAWREWVRDRG